MASVASELSGGNDKNFSANGFFNHMFTINEDNKANILNMIQYIIIGIVPIVILLKLIKYYIPEEDFTKSSPELILECSIQLFSIFFGIWFIDRFIRFFPTYSNLEYHRFNEINFILPIILVLLTMQTKLGSKINILAERLSNLWNGKIEPMENTSNKENKINTIQPIVRNNHQSSRADTLNSNNMQAGTITQNVSNINSLPNMMHNQESMQNMTQQQNLALMQEEFEPMAANMAGGSAFGSSW